MGSFLLLMCGEEEYGESVPAGAVRNDDEDYVFNDDEDYVIGD